ncbi:hypothetical protein LBMAG55_03000 [Verrucomicrobiota bacterium]|nr:hypothetical protein EMGBD4_12020 [Verrucomicrobiota bacterium]GDY16977.1 hypothetical protein LBMAG55_03000 [Verrucomicrobiota bacterium]
MRLLPVCCFVVAAFAADAPLDHARYAAALKEFRAQDGRALATLRSAGKSAEERRAAIDDVRERLVDEPAGPLTTEVAALLAKVAPAEARLLLAALAEAKAVGATAQVAALAGQADSPVRVDAALALAEIGGAKAVPVLAALAKDEAMAEEVVRVLAKVSGPGVTEAFNAGIRDAKADLPGRFALIKAAVARNNRAVAAALCATLLDEPMRLESQKALLKLASPADLPVLRQAEQAVANAATKAALGRLIAKLEKPEGK